MRVCVVSAYSLGAGDPCANLAAGRGACRGPDEMLVMDSSTVKTATVFVFAFTCHQNIFAVAIANCKLLAALPSCTPPITAICVFNCSREEGRGQVANELDRHSAARMERVIGTSIGIGVVIYTTVAIAGYATYGLSAEDDTRTRSMQCCHPRRRPIFASWTTSQDRRSGPTS